MAASLPRHAFLLSVKECVDALDTDVDRGLSQEKADQLHKKYGANELDVEGATSWCTILLRQVFNAMIMVLIFAMGLTFGVGDYVEGGVLAGVIFVNTSIGFYQEYKAQKNMDSLRNLSAPSATVLRDGKLAVISNAKVVPGDIVILKTGDTVPADLRLFEVMNLSCDEQTLTGEAMPVNKITEEPLAVPGTDTKKPAQSEDTVGIADRANLAHGSTTITKGRGRGIVFAVGMSTEVGKIAASTCKKTRKAGRSMNWRKYGKTQPVKGAARRLRDAIGKFLGITEGTPLQRKLSILAYVLFLSALLLALIVFAVNRFNVTSEVLLYAISTGIAIIPESLVAVLTITMVVAVAVMQNANVVVRELAAIEALGGVTNICSDKTGTLTQGAMIVKQVWLPRSNMYSLEDSSDPSNPTQGKVMMTTHADSAGAFAKVEEKTEKRDYDQEHTTQDIKFDLSDQEVKPAQSQQPDNRKRPAEMTPALHMFLLAAALCNLATVRFDEQDRSWHTTGEPTELALQVFSHRFDHGKKRLEASGWKQLSEFPFDSSVKRMSVVHQAPADNEAGLDATNSIVFTKGAAERILDLCAYVGVGDAQEVMTEPVKEYVLRQMNGLASQGLRVLALAYRLWDGQYEASSLPGLSEDGQRSRVESDLTLLGLCGIYDPPRKETTAAIRDCTNAGITVHMLTGDHPETAKSIAQEVGIVPKNLSDLGARTAETCVQKATDFDRLTDAEIDELPDLPLVVARCAPETKTRMIDALRRRGAFMSMTGDGVNDSPSLSRADVGIAMGSGSDVAKSAAKLVLTDDKFNSVVAAIREGRRMSDNVQKFMLHLLSSNVGEIILLIAGLGFQDDSGVSVFPVSALQILWINMITSSFPAFGLGREKAGLDIMNKPPHSCKRGVFAPQVMADMMVYGTLMGTLTLMTFIIVIYGRYDGELGTDCNREYSDSCEAVFRARAAVFAELTWLILIVAWEMKDLRRSLFNLRPHNDRSLAVLSDIYENRFLFFSVVVGAVSVVPVIYIPTLNTKVFKHTGIGWEWGLVLGMAILFLLGCEAWKAIKRRTGILDDHKVIRGPWAKAEENENHSKFSLSNSMSWRSWRSKEKSSTELGGRGRRWASMSWVRQNSPDSPV